MKFTTRIEAAWAAGLFEGEGSVGTQEQNGRIRMRFSLATTDHDVIERFRDAVQAGHISGPRMNEMSTKPIWVWAATGLDDCQHVSGLLLPFLGERRRRAVERAWHGFLCQPDPKPHFRHAQHHCKRGHPFTPGNTRIETSGSRRCLTCDRDRCRRRRDVAAIGDHMRALVDHA